MTEQKKLGNGLTIWLFICPNMDGFHQTGEYVEYLMVHGVRLVVRSHDPHGWGEVHTYTLAVSHNDFIIIDDPTDAMCLAVHGALPGSTVLRIKRVCIHCFKKGVKR